MPGIHDAHIHLLWSGLKFRIECRLRPGADAAEIVEDLCECAKCAGSRLSGWLIGGEFNPNAFRSGSVDRAMLDEAFPDTAIYLYDYSIHHGLANSRALELAGVDASTPDPHGGRYVRRTGSREPTGELVERATWAVKRAIPPYSDDLYRDAIAWAIGMANRFGITSVQEASATLPELEILRDLDAEGSLSLRVAAHLVWKEEAFGGGMSCDALNRLIADRRDYASAHVRTGFVKCWMDGAPLPPHFTQSSIDPTTNRIDASQLVISEDELYEGLLRFDAEGLSLKIHCAGDGAVRTALNAIERVRHTNGDGGPLHEIAHAGFIHPDDRPRLRALRVIAEMSPAVWHYTGPEFAGLADGFKFRTMDALGTRVTIGSDWIITPDPNLFPALQGVLERGHESVDVATALRMMTSAGADAVGMSHEFGTIAPGQLADFIVLDRDPFAVPTAAIGATRVLRTFFEGRCVYESPEECET